jgi:hypothetical protein
LNECNLIKKLKARLLGLAAIEKSMAGQNSSLTWLRKGDINTKYFQLMASIRKEKYFIHSLQSGDMVAISQK